MVLKGRAALVAGTAVLALGLAGVALWPRPAAKADPNRLPGDEHYASAPAEAEKAYREFAAKVQSDPKATKMDHDRAAVAGLKMGYLAAHRKDWKGARERFLAVDGGYKGAGAQSAAFGNAKDQGAYQAAVCLAAMGDKKGAEREFREFIKARKESPLVYAAYKRIVRLKGGKEDPNAVVDLDAAVAAQDAKIRFETSVCGPKSEARFLSLLGKGEFDYRDLAKESGRTDDGTSILGLRKSLKKHGVATFAYRLGIQDVRTAKAPFVALHDDHFVVFEAWDGDAVRVYDPLTGETAVKPLEGLGKSLDVIVTERIEGIKKA